MAHKLENPAEKASAKCMVLNMWMRRADKVRLVIGGWIGVHSAGKELRTAATM